MTDAPVINAAVFAATRIASREQASNLAFNDFMMRVHFPEHDIHMPVAGSVAGTEFHKITPLRCSYPDIGLFGRRPRLAVRLARGRLWRGKFTHCIGVARASRRAGERRLEGLDNRRAHHKAKAASK